MKYSTNHNPQLIAGLNPLIPEDIEFIPKGEGMKVLCLQGGRSYPFKKIAAPIFTDILNEYTNDRGAQRFIKLLRNENRLPYSKVEQVEIYAFFMWGGIDGKPDVIAGVLQPSENFITGEDCPSLHFDKKCIVINDNELNNRDIKIILMAAKDLPNKAIAAELNISDRTLEYHNTRLFRKTGTQSRTGLVSTSYKNHLIA
ncbi:LuxR C-terminal-related transcriptional regulator [Christiangramia forsetii]|uniref:LuxR family transcriptional regulator protein n=2 Tax=Christiangramia forsetii TaxID=411153 RepID=A0M4A1_CHRFK|nr:LuxR C-terminal-related transcriptional regulator [Christiangramia forsetii]GGG23895.1 hypothetical protein GCM10011532_03880 [Christiangramia forsetii]CAL67446.1 LuxR family transcriptional regulator protein [Christiangramia forsetii KT0803]